MFCRCQGRDVPTSHARCRKRSSGGSDRRLAAKLSDKTPNEPLPSPRFSSIGSLTVFDTSAHWGRREVLFRINTEETLQMGNRTEAP
ncbi:hypothetical protein EYF80_025132 [Liparis tanakae]|uniref:Uncharacterized protein n=1 Tax=Liparis tanakae TaxID=230148 RepID=A0A4Z2HI52_9TELE|nr:hypothetical protein EYF80_025132 [Liparis tanakae]